MATVEKEPTRAEAVAQALTDYWEPMRGHKEQFTEIELGQAGWVLDRLDQWDREHEVVRVVANEATVDLAAKMLAGIKYAHVEWTDLEPYTQQTFRQNAQIVLNALSTTKTEKKEF
jgi:hypothetical protein